tara:strand:- start:246 stop:371 length:126 start_codon:yes stop_codon:yes gene_type:complete
MALISDGILFLRMIDLRGIGLLACEEAGEASSEGEYGMLLS